MYDQKIRDLERKARAAPDDVTPVFSLAVARAGVGDNVGAVRAYDRVLTLATQSNRDDLAGFANQQIEVLGVPWVCFTRDELILYAVPHQGVGDSERVPYVFRWDRSLLSRANSRPGSIEDFTQDQANERLVELNSDKVVPTPKEYHSTVRFLADEQLRNAQPVEVAHAQTLFRDDFQAHWMLTSGRVEGASVLQGYGRTPEAQERILADIRGNNDYLRDLAVGPIIAQSVLGADESVEELNSLYNVASGATRGMCVWTRENTDANPRPELLGRVDDVAFSISCFNYIYVGGPARLVVSCRSRKNILSESEVITK